MNVHESLSLEFTISLKVHSTVSEGIYAMKKISPNKLPAATVTQKCLTGHSDEAIKKSILLCADLFHEEMTEAKALFWKETLSEYPPVAIEWAFQNWNRNGDFFPKPRDIIRLIETWRESMDAGVKTCGKCDSGWIIVNPEVKKSEQKAKRCECLR